jgi:hypothetical protein
MDEASVRAMLLQNLEHSRSDPERAHEMYDADAVLEFPQSGERFVGVENFRHWRSNYPATTSFDIRRVRGADDLWVIELAVTYDGSSESLGVSIYEFRDDKIVRETIYVAEHWYAPEWRAQWRDAP